MKITDLKPEIVWKFFHQVTQVPRPSKKEGKMIEFLESFAKQYKIAIKKDAVGNILMSKPATPGKENLPTVVLQSHMDMVCEKNNGTAHDFDHDPIETIVDGNWLRAIGTTLGADYGIGVAAELAILASDDIEHGPIECLFTVDEETGLTGAKALEKGFMTGDILLNLDSETEGERYVGCAGGLEANVTFKFAAEKTPVRNYTAAKITVKGLKGGHSGIQIVCQRANANKVLFRFLNAASASHDVVLCSVDGGGLSNANPSEAEAVVMVKTKEYEAFAKELKAYEKVIKAEYAGIEDAVSIKLKECEAPKERIAAAVAATLGRFAMDVCLYMSQNFGFVSFPDELTTGSSIMPHKKNPDVFEIMRGRCNRLQSDPNEIALLTPTLPVGYHRDLQLLKDILFPATTEIKRTLAMCDFMLAHIRVNEHILDDKKYDYLFTVEDVNRMVLAGTPFREAYKQVGMAVQRGEYTPTREVRHTHEGSIGNLCTAEIRRKMERVMAEFE